MPAAEALRAGNLRSGSPPPPVEPQQEARPTSKGSFRLSLNLHSPAFIRPAFSY